MLDQDYERLVELIRGMIADGVQLIHGGHLFSWSDTTILSLIEKIEKEREKAENMDCEVGDLLQNIYTGQKSAVSWVDNEKIHLLPADNTIVFPKNKIGFQYRKSKPGK